MRSDATNKLLALGTGLWGKIKYDFRFSYSPVAFFKAKLVKEEELTKKISRNLYKKLK